MKSDETIRFFLDFPQDMILHYCNYIVRGAIPGGAQGAQAPPKLGGRKLRILQKGGLKPLYIHHILEN